MGWDVQTSAHSRTVQTKCLSKIHCLQLNRTVLMRKRLSSSYHVKCNILGIICNYFYNNWKIKTIELMYCSFATKQVSWGQGQHKSQGQEMPILLIFWIQNDHEHMTLNLNCFSHLINHVSTPENIYFSKIIQIDPLVAGSLYTTFFQISDIRAKNK